MDSSKHKVLFICNYKPGVGGISGQVEILRSKLALEGYDTSLFSTKGNIAYRLIMIFRLIRVGKHCDIFHIHACSWWGFMPAVIGVYVGRLMKKKVVLTYHGGDAEAFFDRYPAFVKAVLMRTDANVVLSGFLEGVFHKIGAPCVIIPNLHDFKEGVYRRRNTISPSFISVRSHTATYNIECILRAFKKVCLIYPNSSLLVLGDGELHESLVEYVARENIANVSFVGRVDNADIYEYLGKADIMLSSPVVDNMPVSLLEAFNSGLLVISSRVGGVPYMMRDGVEGLMFTSCDSDELVIRMIEAFTNQEDSLRMAEAAHESLAQYQWESVRKKLLTIYG